MNLSEKLRAAAKQPQDWDVPGLLTDAAGAFDDALAALNAGMRMRGSANQEGEAYALERGTKTHKAYCDKIENQMRDALGRLERSA